MKVLCTGASAASMKGGISSEKKKAMLYNQSTFENEFKKEAKFLK
jgi:hypothetical protein